MQTNPEPASGGFQISSVIQTILQVGVLVFIFGWCYLILAPFISPIIWGMIISVTVYPLFKSLSSLLRNRNKLASAIITLMLLAIIVVPVLLLADSMVDGIRHFRQAFDEGTLLIPPPGPETANWPGFTKPILDAWKLASENLQAVVVTYKDQVAAAGKFLLKLLASTGLGILEFVLSIIVAGVLLIYADEGSSVMRRIFSRLSGARADKLLTLCETTIRSVVKGILGVAAIQTLMAGIGFAVAGVPAAGLWTFCCLVLAIVQIGVGPVLIPIIIYMFAEASTTTAVIFMIWSVIIMVSDNFLKPFLLGRGVPVPMLVVFLGAIGGFIARGFVGLFLGAVILSIGYELFHAWANESNETIEKPKEAS